MKIIRKPQDLNIGPKENVLFVYAHPDDETFFSNQIIKFLVDKNVDIKILILSRGETGKSRFWISNGESMAVTRTKEFIRVCKIIGVKKYKLEKFPCSKFNRYEFQLTKYLKNELKGYNTVFTLEPEGIYGHSDHKIVSRIIKDICVNNRNYKLIYTTIKEWDTHLDPFPLYPTHKLEYNLRRFLYMTYSLYQYKSQIPFWKKTWRFIKLVYHTRNEYYHVL